MLTGVSLENFTHIPSKTSDKNLCISPLRRTVNSLCLLKLYRRHKHLIPIFLPGVYPGDCDITVIHLTCQYLAGRLCLDLRDQSFPRYALNMDFSQISVQIIQNI